MDVPRKKIVSFKRMGQLEFFLRTGKYPPGCDKSQKSSIRRSIRKFVLKGGALWHRVHGRLCKVLRSEEEVREVLTQHHENNNHASQRKLLHCIPNLYFWGGMRPAIKKWIENCETCKNNPSRLSGALGVYHRCIAYGCENNSTHSKEGTTFHRFPKDDPKRMDLWMALAQRDRWSIQSQAFLCSKHFADDCFESVEEGRTLKPDAVPTIVVVPLVQEEPLFPEMESNDNLLEIGSLEELVSVCNNTLERSEPTEHVEHQYALPPLETNMQSFRRGRSDVPQVFVKEPCFVRYDALDKYLRTGTVKKQSKAARGSIRRQSKNFVLQDGVLMNTQKPVWRRVIRSREEVNVILKLYHDDQGHKGLTYNYRAISKKYFWGTVTRDLADWIANCDQCCVDRDSRKHQCSVYKCNNYSGPVERGLGITFHPFPIHTPHLLDRWIKAMNRQSWFPRPRSVVCSGHFTEDCFDRSGNMVVLKPGAVPSLFLYQQPLPSPKASKQELSTPLIELAQATTSDQGFFAKYEAVDRYIRKKIYPPGLTFVEKNTIRRYCKKFTIKDNHLHIMVKNRVLKVLRSRQEVNEALAEFHDELNHLDVKKSMRLLTERYFWGTMRVDVARWLENCDVCSAPKKKTVLEPEEHSEPTVVVLEPMENEIINDRAPCSPHCPASVSVIEDNIACWVEDSNYFSASTKKTFMEQEPHQDPAVLVSEVIESEQNTIYLAPCSLNSSMKEGAGEDNDDAAVDNHNSGGAGQQPGVEPTPQPITTVPVMKMVLFSQQQDKVVLVRASDPGLLQLPHPIPQPQLQVKHQIQAQPAAPMVLAVCSQPKPQPQPVTATTNTQTQTRPQTRAQSQTQGPGRGSEHVATSCSKPCPVSTVLRNLETLPEPSFPPPVSQSLSAVLSPAVTTVPGVRCTTFMSSKAPAASEANLAACEKPGGLQARTVIQQCTQALLKIRPAMDGAGAEWVQIQEGIVVYVCFFKRAREEIIPKMVETLLETKQFRKTNGQMVSVLKLPGSVLLIPQDTLSGHGSFKNRVIYQDVAEQPWGTQLYNQLVTGCEKAMKKVKKPSTDSRMRVEHGIYGIKQEILINSQEPFTLLMEF